MKTEWDYTELAEAYLKRADYAPEAVEEILRCAELQPGDPVCDMGAGVAHLTIPLLQHGLHVTAVEPNDAMRDRGMSRTTMFPNVQWREGTGENSGLSSATFALVTFGSSFGVMDRSAALRETARVLRPRAWIACLYNHRDLADPLQSAIEATIKRYIPNYDYGSRRQDQTEAINSSGLFREVLRFERPVLHEQLVTDTLAAWRSHATLHRQAGSSFIQIIDAIGTLLRETGKSTITVPYVTRVWAAQLRT